jgi:hypothetical protein
MVVLLKKNIRLHSRLSRRRWEVKRRRREGSEASFLSNGKRNAKVKTKTKTKTKKGIRRTAKTKAKIETRIETRIGLAVRNVVVVRWAYMTRWVVNGARAVRKENGRRGKAGTKNSDYMVGLQEKVPRLRIEEKSRDGKVRVSFWTGSCLPKPSNPRIPHFHPPKKVVENGITSTTLDIVARLGSGPMLAFLSSERYAVTRNSKKLDTRRIWS